MYHNINDDNYLSMSRQPVADVHNKKKKLIYTYTCCDVYTFGLNNIRNHIWVIMLILRNLFVTGSL